MDAGAYRIIFMWKLWQKTWIYSNTFIIYNATLLALYTTRLHETGHSEHAARGEVGVQLEEDYVRYDAATQNYVTI